ncbi:B-cell antigen receptor complex-associated protein alpha chain, partial [Clarias magur]
AASVAMTSKITVWHDRPGLRLAISEIATMQCCYSSTNEHLTIKWMKHVMISHNTTDSSLVDDQLNRVEIKNANKIINTKELKCSNLILDDIVVNDTALYQCALTEKNTNNTPIYTPGTFLQVYEPINMILGISETSKNSIITAEGVFLLLFVLLPGIALICKSKGLNELEKRKGREEENIYE